MPKKKLEVITKEELLKRFPGVRRPTTDQGYEFGSPLYLPARTANFYDYSLEDVVAYDCKKCGIVTGEPKSTGYLGEVRLACQKCKSIIYQYDLGSDIDCCTT